MKSIFIDQKIAYDGSQLSHLFAYKNFHLMGDSIVSWVGPCDVKNEFMKDGEDLFAGEKIYSESMLHFIIEAFDVSLENMIAYQRLFSAILFDNVLKSIENIVVKDWKRDGDDIYFKDKKLNVSIASAGVLSSMVHCGVNVSSLNTPVSTIGLQDLKLDAHSFSLKMMKDWQNEYHSIKAAKTKVFALT